MYEVGSTAPDLALAVPKVLGVISGILMQGLYAPDCGGHCINKSCSNEAHDEEVLTTTLGPRTEHGNSLGRKEVILESTNSRTHCNPESSYA